MPDPFTPNRWVRRSVLRLAMGGLAAVSTAASARAEDGKAEVKIDNFAFVPMALTVKKGTEVTWINHDDIPHTVIGIGGGPRSKAMDTDGTFTYRFDKTGTFNYICGLHPHMKAKVVVTG